MAQTLWGIKDGTEGKPNWLTEDQKTRTYASNGGWVLRHNNGIEETLVSIANLRIRLGSANITEIRFVSGTYTAGGTKSVRVSFNEAVTVTGSPTLVVTGSVSGSVTATYSSMLNANTAVFTFTVPAAGQTLSVGTQTIALNGGTVVDANSSPSVNSTLTIGAAALANTGTKTTV